MASEGSDELTNLNLTADERQVYGQLFRQADPESVGIVMGEVAVKFFEKTRLDSRILGEIWQIADRENRGFLTPAGFSVALRLIGHAQAHKEPTPSLALKQGPLPRFEGIHSAAGVLPPQAPLTGNVTGPLSAQGTGSGVGAPQISAQGTGSGAASRVPPLAIEKAVQYARVFQDQANGETVMSGEKAKRIFEKSGLGIDILGRIWQLADTEQRGGLVQTEFIIAMHLLTSTKVGSLRVLPTILPAALYDDATRGAAAFSASAAAIGSPSSPVARQQSPLGASFGASGIPSIPPPPPTASRQLTGLRPAAPNFSAGPIGQPASTAPAGPNTASSGSDPKWIITPAEKARMDTVFRDLDKSGRGYITGEQAVPFLQRSYLDDNVLAQIWDLADVNSDGHLTSDTFAVALHLIQQQRSNGGTLPSKLPLNLIPPSMRSQLRPTSPPVAAPAAAPAPPPPKPQPKSAFADLFDLDSGPSSTPSLPALSATPTGAAGPSGVSDPFAGSGSPIQPSSPTRSSTNNTSSFKPFVPSSSFGRSLTTQGTGDSNSSAPTSSQAKFVPAPPSQPTPPQHAPFAISSPPSASAAQNDLLGGDDGDASRNLSNDTTELANISNQIGSLSKHMQETSTHRSTLQNELSQTGAQKKKFEQRLAQLRALYEKEARDVRALEEQLKTSQSETKSLQVELTTLEASYRDLQTQHQTIFGALQADQQENSNLKERMRAVSAEVNQLKPQIEKLKSEARQQKGIVAINRKQLSLGESERDKLKTEAEDLTRQNQDLARQIHNASVVSAASSSASPSVASASGKNPFFRRTGSTDIMGVFSSQSQGQQSPSQAAAASKSYGDKSFDDVFGPVSSSSHAATPIATPIAAAAVKPQVTGASTGSSSFSAVTAPTSEAATPGASRQGTFSLGSDAASTSDQHTFSHFSPTASSAAATETPTEAAAPAESISPTARATPPTERAASTASPAPAAATYKSPFSLPEDASADESVATEEAAPTSSGFSGFGIPAAAAAAVTAATAGVAAAVVGNKDEASSPAAAADTDEKTSVWNQGHGQNDSLSDPFSSMDQQQDKAKEDFESAFASFKAARSGEPSSSSGGAASGFADAFEVKSPAIDSNTAATSAFVPKSEEPANTDTAKAISSFNTEFPPISELNRDDESDSDTDGGGFDDDFAPASPAANFKAAAAPEPTASAPETTSHSNGESAAASKTASPELAKSVPAEAAPAGSAPAGSDAFSPATAAVPSSVDDIFSAPSAAAPAAATSAAGPAAPATSSFDDAAFDDLDDDFDGLEEAREGSADDDFANISRSGLDDFQSTFDSSPAGKGSFGVDSNSFDFSTLGASTSAAGATSASPANDGSKAAADSSDWFSFSADESKPAAEAVAPTAAATAATTGSESRPAELSRLPTQESTTDDDPILTKLRSMGYSRSVALSALEKYDYNVDRAANYLASQS